MKEGMGSSNKHIMDIKRWIKMAELDIEEWRAQLAEIAESKKKER